MVSKGGQERESGKRLQNGKQAACLDISDVQLWIVELVKFAQAFVAFRKEILTENLGEVRGTPSKNANNNNETMMFPLAT